MSESDEMLRPYDLPPLTALSCFEAAARNLSFKRAAAELNVTPAAISHQIRKLETDLATELFRRQHRGVELTESGAYLFLALQRGFEGISDAVRDLRLPSDAEDVVIQATSSVSAYWLTPQITAFWKQRPDISVSQIVSDTGQAAGRADLSIRYGEVEAGDGASVPLFRGDIIAVGTAAFAREHGLAEARDLRDVPLIHVMAEGTDWTGWAQWLDHVGLGAPRSRGMVVNNHMIALQLARDGVGAVLGWTGLIGSLMQEWGLIQLVPEAMPSPHSFQLLAHPRATRLALVLRDWLADTARAGDIPAG